MQFKVSAEHGANTRNRRQAPKATGRCANTMVELRRGDTTHIPQSKTSTGRQDRSTVSSALTFVPKQQREEKGERRGTQVRSTLQLEPNGLLSSLAWRARHRFLHPSIRPASHHICHTPFPFPHENPNCRHYPAHPDHKSLEGQNLAGTNSPSKKIRAH